jgi:hypothetical protein
VTQESNSRETVFCSDGNVVGSALQGVISVQSADDDDFIGFAFGYAPGDNNNPNADYLLFGKTERMMHLFLADFEWHVFLNSVSFNIYIYIYWSQIGNKKHKIFRTNAFQPLHKLEFLFLGYSGFQWRMNFGVIPMFHATTMASVDCKSCNEASILEVLGGWIFKNIPFGSSLVRILKSTSMAISKLISPDRIISMRANSAFTICHKNKFGTKVSRLQI